MKPVADGDVGKALAPLPTVNRTGAKTAPHFLAVIVSEPKSWLSRQVDDSPDAPLVRYVQDQVRLEA
jgi:hypothetical protein